MKTGKRARKPASTRALEGFTLLEVLVALLILMLFLVPILGAIQSGLRSIESARKRSLALRLAQDKMTEIEMLPFPDAEGTEEGEFDDKEYPGYRWETEMIKTPDLQLMEEYVPGFQAMEVHLRVFWEEAGAVKSIEVNTLLMK